MHATGLFTVWTKPSGELRIYTPPAAVFSEFFPISEQDAQAVLGSEEWHVVRGPEEAEAFMRNLAPIFSTPSDPT
jgi:hypothetical protein